MVMDNEEQRMLQDDHGSTSITETNKVAETTVPLHMVHHFTDVWATDGSLTQETDAEGRSETRVGCGAYKGMQPLQRNDWE